MATLQCGKIEEGSKIQLQLTFSTVTKPMTALTKANKNITLVK